MAQMVATETFRAVVNGFSDLFTAGETIVDEDHEAVRAHPDKFAPVRAERPEVEDASAAPGVKRGPVVTEYEKHRRRRQAVEARTASTGSPTPRAEHRLEGASKYRAHAWRRKTSPPSQASRDEDPLELSNAPWSTSGYGKQTRSSRRASVTRATTWPCRASSGSRAA
jgi:hypothetical protein